MYRNYLYNLSSDASLAIRQRFLDIFTDKTGKGYQKSLRLYPYPEGMRCAGYIVEDIESFHRREIIQIMDEDTYYDLHSSM